MALDQAAHHQADRKGKRSSFVVRNVRVWDGARCLPESDVWVEEGRIKAVSSCGEVASNAVAIDGRGKTLIPGLIDAHTHVFSAADLKSALLFGVTTVLDMANDYRLVSELKREQTLETSLDRADLLSAGTPVTAPHGHGTANTFRVPAITCPREADQLVDRIVGEGSDYVKIIYEDGSAYGFSLATLDQETLRAVVRAAHERGKMAVAHISSLRAAREVISAGIDGLVHLFADQAPDPLFASFAAENHVFVIPTLTVLESSVGIRTGIPLVQDARVQNYLTSESRACLEMTIASFPGRSRLNFAHAQRTVRELSQAKVPLLAGTDASNPGTAHGPSLHRELDLLVQSGMTPTEALAAATSVPARVFRLDDRGQIAIGRRADLVLVNGDPTTNITATRDIVAVWKAGIELGREQGAKQAQLEEDMGPPGSQIGLVSDFADGICKTYFGSGWVPVCDGFIGGRSWARIDVTGGGSNGSNGCLSIFGEVDPHLSQPWAGAIFYPGRAPFYPANLASKQRVRFWARDEESGTYKVALHYWKNGLHRVSQGFSTSTSWREYCFPLSVFSSDGRGVLGLLFLAGPDPGKFSFQIDEVRIE